MRSVSKRKKEFLDKEDVTDTENKKTSKNFIRKIVRNLMKKKQKLSQKILKSKSWEKNYSVMLELEEVEEELSSHYSARRRKEEKEAIQRLKSNPKYFYSYQKRFSKTVNTIGDFVKKNGEIITDPVEKAEKLKDQYESVASKPDKEFIVNNAAEFFSVKKTIEEQEDNHDSIELLLDDEVTVMPPLSLHEEEDLESDEDDEDEELECTKASEDTEDDDNEEEDEEEAPLLCYECTIEAVHECSEDKCSEDGCSKDEYSKDECS